MSSSLLNWLGGVRKYATFTNVTYFLVGAIALLSFAMSYSVLSEDARRYGIRFYGLFPIVLDASIVVFLMFWVWAGNNVKLARQGVFAVGVATGISILLNVSHAIEWQGQGMSTMVMVLYFIIPPVALFVASHFVAEMYKVSQQKPELTEQQKTAVKWASGEIDDREFAKLINMSPKTVAGWRRKMEV